MDATNKILYKEEIFAIIGACMKVHRSLDFVCYDTIIIEIKAVSQIPVTFYAQLKNYLKDDCLLSGLNLQKRNIFKKVSHELH